MINPFFFNQQQLPGNLNCLPTDHQTVHILLFHNIQSKILEVRIVNLIITICLILTVKHHQI